MGDTMMISGPADASFRIDSTLKMAPGLGLLSNILIDQHFAERGRIGRLLGATAHNPKNLGVGIDENTAIIFENPEEFKVIGTGAVYVIDAHETHGSNLSEATPDTPLSLYNIKLHLLTKGSSFNVKYRVPSKSE